MNEMPYNPEETKAILREVNEIRLHALDGMDYTVPRIPPAPTRAMLTPGGLTRRQRQRRRAQSATGGAEQ